MMNVVMVFLGGGLGSLSRYGLAGFAHRVSGAVFPVGTLCVNLIGCFVIGFAWAVSEKIVLPSQVRLFFFVGFLGGFTTFSSFGLETFGLLRDGQIRYALWNVLANNVLGLGLVLAGFALARLILK